MHNELPSLKDLDAFSPVDFLFFVLPLYPIVIFFLFSKRIKNVTLHKMIRTFIIMLLLTFPMLMIEDIFGSFSIIFDFARDNPMHVRLFPAVYLMIYLFLLYQGFRNVILEERLSHTLYQISVAFVTRYGVTERERANHRAHDRGRQQQGNRQEAVYFQRPRSGTIFTTSLRRPMPPYRVELIRIATS